MTRHTIVLSTSYGAEDLDKNITLIKSRGFNCLHVGNLAELEAIDMSNDISIISDRTTFLIPDRIATKVTGLAVNLHNSLLPLHPGSFALFWSCIFGDPYGLTVHRLTNDLDGGGVLFQSSIPYKSGESFRDVYKNTRLVVNSTIDILLLSLKLGIDFETNIRKPKTWTMHLSKNAIPLIKILPLSWDTPIADARVILQGFHDENGRVINATDTDLYRG